LKPLKLSTLLLIVSVLALSQPSKGLALHFSNQPKLSVPFASSSKWHSFDPQVSSEKNLSNLSFIEFKNQNDGKINLLEAENGKFMAEENDTWFIYGLFGEIKSNQKETSPTYRSWGGRHNGIDFSAKYGLAVTSASNGKVVFTGNLIGETVIIEVENQTGLFITYGHLSNIKVKVGERVLVGQEIGNVGNSGEILNPHLHFEVDQMLSPNQYLAINPLLLLDLDSKNAIIPECSQNSYPEEIIPTKSFIWSL